jgi:hypothetical protein
VVGTQFSKKRKLEEVAGVFSLSAHQEEARHPAGPHAGVISYGAAVDLRTYLTKKNLAAA